MKTLRGRYIRPAPIELMGETALLRRNTHTGGWFAQFDNLEKFSRNKHDWAIGWHTFSADSFTLLEENEK